MPPKRRLSSLTGGEEDLEDPLATEGVEEIIMEEEESVLGVEGEVIQQAATIPPHAMPQLEQERQRSITPEPGKKRKKIDPQQQMQSLYDFLRRYKREDGSELCEPFIRAPKRRSDPSYYEVVSDPIDLLRIQQKLKTEEYSNMPELKADFKKLFANAYAFYKKDSPEYTAAMELSDLYTKALEKIEAGEDPVAALGNREDSDEGDLQEMLEDLFAAIIVACDSGEGARPWHLAFRFLPSQKRYPEYYTVIEKPLDLKTIATRIQNNEYESLAKLEEDIQIMTKNAMHFNEPGSQIYKDAKNISKLAKSKKYELEVSKVARDNRGARSSRRAHVKRHYSLEMSELQYEESESDESEEDTDTADVDDPLWALYSHVRNYETTSGLKLYEPFLTLPSKRELPDYYEVIKEPISLSQIRKKLKAGEYEDIQDLAMDLNLMFKNCKSYNRPDSRLYKEGVRLQKVMQSKLEELDSDEEEVESNKTGDFEKMSSPVRSPGPKDPMKKRMQTLYNSVLNYTNRDNVNLIGMFMEKPSRKDYPDYYEVIAKPIDMTMIQEKIKNGIYRAEDELIADMKLMFSNCRQYNEEGSGIYEDAIILEKVLISKGKEMGLIQTSGRGRPKASSKTGVLKGPSMAHTSTSEKVKTLYDSLKEHKDSKGRQLSLIFLKLPHPKEFPDYFEVIKNPIDFEKIGLKIKQNGYASLEDCLSDFILMFDNACKFNEPDSQIYKDALTLQSLASRTCRSLQDDDSSCPDVQAAVQEILTYIFISMYNHQDAEDRCFSDSLAELPEHDEIDGKPVRALSLDLIKRRLDRGLYKRLDIFQRDVFTVLERARNLSKADSQIFEDANELQTHFIKVRDSACGHGTILQSRALLFTEVNLANSVDISKQSKPPGDGNDDDSQDAANVVCGADGTTSSVTFGQQQYHVGEFVYVESADKAQSTSIFLIERIYAKGGEQMMYGNQFFYPSETFHVSTRKFLENEVFRTENHLSVPLSKIVGRCMVVPVRDYFRSKPEGFEDKDVHVCESRYSSKSRSFKKMKLFWTIPEHIRMVQRDVVLEPKRVMSVFKERIEKHKEELEEIEAMVNTVANELPPNVLWMNAENLQPGCIYYEQYTIPGPITLRRGDHVYVRSENGKNLIAQIDSMWRAEADGMAYFHGPWYVTPRETAHPTSQMFYKQETFLSTISDTNPLLSVVGKCSVLDPNQYIHSRATQYNEPDVYICESIYDESKRQIKANPTGRKQYEYSTSVQTDEIYLFKNPISVQKEPSPLLVKQPAVVAPTPAVIPPTSSMPMEVDNEDSMDAPPSLGSTEGIVPPTTPAVVKKVKTPGKKVVTPYILFSSETRRIITDTNKGCSFGEISRIVGDKKPKTRPRSGYQIFSSKVWVKVKAEMEGGNFAEVSREIGNQWRQLPDAEKSIYEEKARKVNEENALKFAEDQRQAEERRRQDAAAQASQVQQQQPQLLPGSHPNGANLVMVNTSGAATPMLMNGNSGAAGGRPQQLLQQQQPQPQQPQQKQPMQYQPGQRHRTPSQSTIAMPVEPMFHTVPPRPQRLLHSEAYIRYIEGLTADSQTMSNWKKQMNSTKENTGTDEAKLPAHWLANNGEHGTSLDALWALRDFMMCDSLGLSKLV